LIFVELMSICYFVVVWIVLQVMEVLGFSELLALIYKVDVEYHSKFSDSQSCYLDHVLKYVPTILGQLQVGRWTHENAIGCFL
jgi:hypothetical protein